MVAVARQRLQSVPEKLATLAKDLDVAVAITSDATARKLLKAVEEFCTYIDRNRAFIPNYGECYRYGERISTDFVESTVNQVISKRFCKKEQMQWTKRSAHLLLQTRGTSPAANSRQDAQPRTGLCVQAVVP